MDQCALLIGAIWRITAESFIGLIGFPFGSTVIDRYLFGHDENLIETSIHGAIF